MSRVEYARSPPLHGPASPHAMGAAVMQWLVRVGPGVAGTVTTACAVLVLAGWAFDVPPLKSVHPSFVTMKPNAAVGFLAAGLALLLRRRQPATSISVAATLFSCLAAAVGALTLVEYAHAPGIDIDALLFREGPNPVFTSRPGRMSPATALCFVLLGAALLVCRWTTRRRHWPSGIMVGPVLQIGLLAIVGYALGTQSFQGMGSQTAMALHSAALFIVLGVGLVCLRPQLGLVAIVTSTGMGGIMARSLLAGTLVFPVALGWLLAQAVQAGFFSVEFALSFFAMASIGSVVGLVWLNGFLLERMGAERHAQLESAHARLQWLARRHERRLDALSRCSAALARATDEQGLLEEVCRIIVEVGGYRMCWVGVAERDERKTVRPVAHAGHEDGYLSIVDAVWSDDAERGLGPSGRAIRTRQPVVVRDVGTDRGFDPWRGEALKRGYASLLALPLVAEGVALGVLRIYAGEIDAFDDEELELLKQLADDLAFGAAALRARAERDSVTAQLIVADRMVSVGTLAAGAAHEINNPLAYIIGALDFLHGELSRVGERLPAGELEEARQALADARAGAARVKHVVRDLKTFSRAQEERRARVDVRTVMESSVDMAFVEIKYRARLVKNYGITPPVLVNEARLGQVFLNLLINAAQAIPEGHAAENEIRVATRTDEAGRACVEVRDTGAGIPDEAARRIFDPFFTTKPVGVGTGLGLSICRNIITAAGGEITLTTQPGETAFRVILPPAPAAAEEVPPEELPSPARGRRGHVLVVDDEPAIGAAIRRVLAPEHDVSVLTDAAEALELLSRGERFDVILCDLMMPRMTGMDLHAQLTALAPEQARRMVFLTGGAFTSRAGEFLDRVSNARVDKPFEPAALLALVRALVD